MISVAERLDVHARSVVGVNACLLALASVTTFLRFLTRYRLKTSLRIDDWLVLPGWLSFLAVCTIELIGVRDKVVGYSTPKDAAAADNTAHIAAQIYMVLDFFQAAVLGGVKISIVFFFRRVFTGEERKLFSHLTAIAVLLLLLWTALFMLISFFQCKTHGDAAEFSGRISQYCGNEQSLHLGFAISDLALNILVLLLPLPNTEFQTWMLQTTVREKIALTAVFFLSLVGLGASIMRLVVCATITTSVRYGGDTLDLQVISTSILFFGTLEAGVTLIVANLPIVYGLASTIPPDDIFRGIRSKLSLHSIRSTLSDRRVVPRRFRRQSAGAHPQMSRGDPQIFQPQEISGGITVSTSAGSRFVDHKNKTRAIGPLRGGEHDRDSDGKNKPNGRNCEGFDNDNNHTITRADEDAEEMPMMRRSAIYVTQQLSVTTEYRTEEV